MINVTNQARFFHTGLPNRVKKNQLMHNLFLVYLVNLYMFRACTGPSSGGTTVCIQQLVFFILFRWLYDDSHLKTIINTNCCIHTVYLLMMGLDTPETCRSWRNILRISCASSWFFFTRLCRPVWKNRAWLVTLIIVNVAF